MPQRLWRVEAASYALPRARISDRDRDLRLRAGRDVPIVKLCKLNDGALSRQGSAQKSRETTKMLNIYRQ